MGTIANEPIVALRNRIAHSAAEVKGYLQENQGCINAALSLLADETSYGLVREYLDLIDKEQFRISEGTGVSEMPLLMKRLKASDSDLDRIKVLATSVISDLWEIPLFVKEIIGKCEIRAMSEGDGSLYYALDFSWLNDRSCKGDGKQENLLKRVVAVSGAMYSFSNVDLVKAFGIIPYLFHAEYGCDVKMVTYDTGEEYPYQKLLPGLEIVKIKDKRPVGMVNYVRENAVDIDLLILQGAYEYNHDVVVTYKKENPTGKIFMNLDQNSEWMDRIIWDDPSYREMMDLVDIKGSTCKPMQDHLNEKWPWHIDCVHQGYYNIFGFEDDMEKVLANKEKTILCVARHGTWQKATEVLLEAFARIEAMIPEWRLELVGSIEEEFKSYIEEYYGRYPLLRDRVVFFGNIQDRQKLHEHFLKAGIFTLTSRVEGGTPNVIAEALKAGCAIALTRFDAYPDTVGPLDDEDKVCGLTADIDDIDGYADILERLCNSDDLDELQRNACWRADRYFDAIKIERELYGKLIHAEQ
ncbi:MAG: glycosyltransferase family 4 protein [Lachnospiraceae bacterium]|nr:glycosyltransferase family 4 protein [Lachnospiraceae bacterium]